VGVCVVGFCNGCVFVCVGFVMCVCLSVFGFCDVCVCVGFVMGVCLCVWVL
jgi:hypothetical protein